MYNEECIMKKKEYTRPHTMLIAIGAQYGMMDTGSMGLGEGNPGEIMSKENTSTWDFEEEENQ